MSRWQIELRIEGEPVLTLADDYMAGGMHLTDEQQAHAVEAAAALVSFLEPSLFYDGDDGENAGLDFECVCLACNCHIRVDVDGTRCGMCHEACFGGDDIS